MGRVFEVEPDWNEISRRVRAAMAYAGKNRTEAAQALKTSPASFDRVIGTKGNERKTPTWKDLGDFAEACDLPREWFTADFSRLGEIVTEPLVSQSGGAASAARAARARRALELTEEAERRLLEEQRLRDEPGRSGGTGS